MGRAGPQLPPKKCAVIITTFFGTKPQCSHGYAWLQVQWRPSMSFYSTQTHTVTHIQISYCIAWILQFSLPPILPCLPLRGYLHTFHPTQAGSVAELWENVKPAPSASLWQPIVFPHLLSKAFVQWFSSGFTWRLFFRDLSKCKQRESQRYCC